VEHGKTGSSKRSDEAESERSAREFRLGRLGSCALADAGALRVRPKATPNPEAPSPHTTISYPFRSSRFTALRPDITITMMVMKPITNCRVCGTPLLGDREPLAGICGVCATPVRVVVASPEARSPVYLCRQ
jgi:hypothetical protein